MFFLFLFFTTLVKLDSASSDETDRCPEIFVRPVASPLGVEIEGISIENWFTEHQNCFSKIISLLTKYHLLIIRNQTELSIQGQRKFSMLFGTLQVHIDKNSHDRMFKDVNIISNIINSSVGKPIGLQGKSVENFHSDYSWLSNSFSD